MIYIAALVIAIFVLFWDKTSSDHSVTQPKSTQGNTLPAALPKSTFTENLNVESDFSSDMSFCNDKETQILSEPKYSYTIADMSEGVRNLFAASDELIALTQKQELSQQEEEIEKLISGIHLTGILIGTRRSCVLINGQVVFRGDDIGPYRLEEIGQDRVILGYKENTLELLLAE
jgi:hypothetical protein